MADLVPNQEQWRCPWCGSVALRSTRLSVLCVSRECLCGAIVLAAPRHDFDEILDVAVSAFELSISIISLGDTRLMVQEMEKAGVEIAVGMTLKHSVDGGSLQHQYLWFRFRPVV
jgi:hypothetical protein